MRKGLSHHLPDVVHPVGTVCFQVEVPNDPWYLRAWYGTFFELASARSWDDDPQHTALEVAAVWLQIALKLKPGCGTAQGSAGADGDSDYMIRQNPDNPCLLESSVDGLTWCAWADLSKCLVANPVQPTGGGQPGAGSETCHDFSLNANGLWLLPFQVNAGDLISVTDLAGAWTDGSTSWYCPDGNGYALGACFAYCGHPGGDPSAVACHMAVIAMIAGTAYPVVDGVLSVPSGITNENLTLQANDASLSDNFGTIQGKICVQRPSGSYALTYVYGSGPASVRDGDIVTLTAQARAEPPSNGAYNIEMGFSPCVKMEIVGSSGWTDNDGVGGNVSWNQIDCASVGHATYPPTTLASWGNPALSYMGLNSVTPFTITVRFTHV